jgi:septal ring factor EnvC (AmiA/AmiB activator)
MNEQWPPPAPGVNKAFKKAHDATNDNSAPKKALPIVTKKEIQELEKQLNKSKLQWNLTPLGMKRSSTADRELERRIARMKERLQKPKDKARDDFERSM